MTRKYLAITLLTLISLIPTVSVFGFEHIDNINNGISVYFLVHLEADENIVINVTHVGDGNFTLFLYDRRPTESFINFDNSLNSEIFDIAISYSLEDNPYINYTVSESKIYYIELILVENGPDTFFFNCNNDGLTRYYLPIIPGYPIGFLILAFIITTSIIILVKKKSIK
ncbi:MAG: Loki-CTERM sorting domain-containing protein [Candidatus Hermodarchaeota archaeon]